MTSQNLSKLLMAIGSLDDLSEAIKKGNCVNMDTLPKKLNECSELARQAIQQEIELIRDEYERKLADATVGAEIGYGLSKKLMKGENY